MVAIRRVSGWERRLVQVDLRHLGLALCRWDIANLSSFLRDGCSFGSWGFYQEKAGKSGKKRVSGGVSEAGKCAPRVDVDGAEDIIEYGDMRYGRVKREEGAVIEGKRPDCADWRIELGAPGVVGKEGNNRLCSTQGLEM